MVTDVEIEGAFLEAVKPQLHKDLIDLAGIPSPVDGGRPLMASWLAPRPHYNGLAWTFQYLLAQHFSKDAVILEIGTMKGTGTVCLGKGSGRPVHCIDIERSRFDLVKERTPEKFEEVSIYRVIGDSHDQAIWEQAPKDIDFLSIDGDHSYEGCMLDWDMYTPLVKIGGLVYLDDTFNTDWPGVRQCADELEENIHFGPASRWQSKGPSDYISCLDDIRVENAQLSYLRPRKFEG